METNVPPKTDIDAIFHRLRSIPANKSCFDCGQKNPTWASVTYGVFICIDCSAVHRGLGVHLTFVRSTNLDTNWTWLQIRNMQCGGNANASAFFRQHNCTTTDAQHKYTSRAASLYRDKLSNSSQQAMKVHGTALYFDATHTEVEKKRGEEDFFAEHTNDNNEDANQNYSQPTKPIATVATTATQFVDKLDPEGAPSVDFLNSTVAEAPKSTIGIRKVQPKRTGVAKKGGLGATKVKTNFADIEHRAVMADQIKEPLPQKPLTAEEEEEAEQSVRLAYQDLSLKQQREEEKLKATDPAKARQMERLGMGFVNRSAVSHSLLTDMKTISQENTTKFTAPKASAFEREDRDFFDDYSMYNNGSGGGGASKTKYLDFSAAEADDFEIVEPIVESSPAVRSMFVRNDSTTTKSSTGDNYQPRNTKQIGTPKGAYELDEAQKKFGSAKGISSDQFFNNDSSSSEGKANLTRFQGSNSISSSDYFGDPTSDRRGGSRSMEFNAPDLDDVKESVKQGVNKVAGRISSLATNVMSSIQDKYGY